MTKAAMTVEKFLAELETSDIALIHRVRAKILGAGSALVEGIKWNAPSYSLDGNDIITFNFRSYGAVALVFHTGPKGKDTHTGRTLFDDHADMVHWVADKRFVVKIVDEDWFEKNSSRLGSLVVQWVALANSGFTYPD